MALVHVNSRYRDSVSFNNFRVNLDLPKLKSRFDTVTLSSVCVPNGWYNINSENNIITFNEGGSNLQATLPIGFYSASTITTAIETAMNSASTLPQTYTCSY